MKIRNGEIEKFIDFLMNLKLKGKESRMRTRFAKLLEERLLLVRGEHQDLIKEHSSLDENGEPKTIKSEDGDRYDVKDFKAFNADFNELMLEEYIIEETDERKDMLISVQDSILNCDIEFSGNEAVIYDRWCEIVEEIEYGDKE